jgi:hypothetical protein
VQLVHRADNSASLFMPNVKVRVEVQHSITPLSHHDLLWESFTFTILQDRFFMGPVWIHLEIIHILFAFLFLITCKVGVTFCKGALFIVTTVRTSLVKFSSFFCRE